MLGRIVVCLVAVVVLSITGCGREENAGIQEKAQQAKISPAKATDPVCGMEVDETSVLTLEYEGKTYYFCSETCYADFLKNPYKYIREEGVSDPVCGMRVTRTGEITSEYGGKTYHFCSAHCKTKFENHPARFIGEQD